MESRISLPLGRFVEASIFALEKGKTSYTDNRGLLSLRKEISAYVERHFGPAYDPGSEILVTVGVSEAIDIALRALLNPGDKVLYHEPCYVSYAPSISLAFGEAIPVATNSEDSFALDPNAFEQAWEPGLQGIDAQFSYQPNRWYRGPRETGKTGKICCGKRFDRNQR